MLVNRVISPRRFWLHAVVISLLALSLNGCGGPATDEAAYDTGEALPELTDEIIRERLNGVRIGPIPEESGASEPISWRFFSDEPKDVTIVEKNVEGGSATVVVDIKTTSSPRSREPRQLAGRVKLEWLLRSGMVLRRWEVVGTENISVKYKNLPKPAGPTPPSLP
jgi:hypothetical protein